MLSSNLRCSDENCERMFMHSLDADEACSYSAIDVRTARGRFTTRALRLRPHQLRGEVDTILILQRLTKTTTYCKMFKLFNQTFALTSKKNKPNFSTHTRKQPRASITSYASPRACPYFAPPEEVVVE